MADKKQVTIRNPEILALADWGKVALKAQLLPTGMNIFQAMSIVQTGKELGLPPMQSLRSMSFIKGRLSMSVQLQLALARNKGVEVAKVDEDDGKCSVTLTRANETITCTYTLDDAKKAGLVRGDSGYVKYPRQMLRWRATGDALRLIAPDAVMGLLSPDEAESIEPFKPAEERIEAEFEEVKNNGSKAEAEDTPDESPAKKADDGNVTENQIADLFILSGDAGINVNKLQNHCQKHYPHINGNLRKLARQEYVETLEWVKTEGNKKERAKKQ